jgi:signal transduction histidine kinase
MQPGVRSSTVITHFAPAERASREQLRTSRDRFLSDRIASTVLEGIPDPVLVLNRERQIVACNSLFLAVTGKTHVDDLLGVRPGEAAQCIHCDEGPGGCGTGEHCIECGAVQAILECLQSRQSVTRECRLRTRGDADGGALDLLVQANLITLQELEFVVVALRDVSGEKRRRVLERVFFHDVLNTATGIYSIAWQLNDVEQAAEEEAECKRDLLQLSEQIADEIAAQRQLLAAERGELSLDLREVSLPGLLEEVAAAYRHHNAAHGRELRVTAAPPVHVRTDPTLLRRVLGNLVKNALEATPEGGAVSVWAEEIPDKVVFFVKNPGAMPESVQRQIFQRSFTTKRGEGRGIGTHSVKLFAERYLRGHVDFTSTEAEGTVFSVALPKDEHAPSGGAGGEASQSPA